MSAHRHDDEDVFRGPGADRLDALLDELKDGDAPPAGLVGDVIAQVRRTRTVKTERLQGGIGMVKRALIGVAAAAAVVFAVFSTIGWPTVGGGTAGTIGVAQRYHAQPMTASDVQLGDTSLQEVLQSDVVARLMADPEARAVLANPGIRAALASADLRHALSDAQLRSALVDANVRAALADAGFRQALADPNLRVALSSPELRHALQGAAFGDAQLKAVRIFAEQNLAVRQALKIDAFASALQSGALAKALSSDAFAKALHSDAFVSALQSGSLARALSSAEFVSALQSGLLAKGLQNGFIVKALGDQGFAKALNNPAFGQRFSAAFAK